MEKTKIINGKECYFAEVKFSIDDFHSPEEQENFSEGEAYITLTDGPEDQELYSVASYRTRLQEAERPVFMRLKLMIRDVTMLVKSGNLDEKKLGRLRRLFTDDLTSLIQEAAEMSRTKGGQTVDLILKLNSLGSQPITKAGRKLGITLRKINRIRDRMKFIPKMQQEELNSALVELVSLVTAQVFDTVNVRTFDGFNKDEGE